MDVQYSQIMDLTLLQHTYYKHEFLGSKKNLLLQVEKVRKLCGFNVLSKAKQWAKDNCTAANINWLYPLTDQIDTYI